jgi:TetR/AcrR family transcriptional repressor of nem operon
MNIEISESRKRRYSSFSVFYLTDHSNFHTLLHMTRGKPLSFDRDEALQRAMEYFWEHGYEASGMTGLLEHMGIQRQSFYNTFGSKEDVLLESIQMYADAVRQRFREALDGAATPFEKLDRIFSMWEQMDGDDKPCGCFLGNCTAEFGQSNEKVKAIMDKNLAGLRATFTEIFQEAIYRGDLPPEREADKMATTLFTYSQGLALASKSGTSKEHLKTTMQIMKQSLKQ